MSEESTIRASLLFFSSNDTTVHHLRDALWRRLCEGHFTRVLGQFQKTVAKYGVRTEVALLAPRMTSSCNQMKVCQGWFLHFQR